MRLEVVDTEEILHCEPDPSIEPVPVTLHEGIYPATRPPVIEEITITGNGTTVAPDGVNGYSPVHVNVPDTPLAPLTNPATDGCVIAGKEFYDDQKIAHTGSLETLAAAGLTGTTVLDGHLMADITNSLDGDTARLAVAEAEDGTEYQPSLTDQNTPDGIFQATPNVFKAITKERLAELDADFAAENIKKDVNVFGLVGTYAGGGGVQTYSGTMTLATQSLTASIIVPKSIVSNPQLVVIKLATEAMASIAAGSVAKAGGVRSLTTNYTEISSVGNALNGVVFRTTTTDGLGTGQATITFSDSPTATQISVVSSNGYFRAGVDYNFTVYGWEDAT